MSQTQLFNGDQEEMAHFEHKQNGLLDTEVIKTE